MNILIYSSVLLWASFGQCLTISQENDHCCWMIFEPRLSHLLSFSEPLAYSACSRAQARRKPWRCSKAPATSPQMSHCPRQGRPRTQSPPREPTEPIGECQSRAPGQGLGTEFSPWGAPGGGRRSCTHQQAAWTASWCRGTLGLGRRERSR